MPIHDERNTAQSQKTEERIRPALSEGQRQHLIKPSCGKLDRVAQRADILSFHTTAFVNEAEA
jgi:hypothetical protein